MMFKVRIFIETSYRGLKPSAGWYWTIVEYQTAKGPATVEYKKKAENVTGNRLSLLALAKGMEALKKPCEIEVFTDSNYLYRAFTQKWMEGWRISGWKTANGEPVKNGDLWEELDAKIAPHFVVMRLCRNHEYKNAMQRELRELSRKGA